MKKTLIFIIILFFCFSMNSFATIHKSINTVTTSIQKTPFNPFLSAKNGTIRQECVQIHLKAGIVVYGKVSSMDATHLFFKSCDYQDTIIKSILITTLSQVTNTHGKVIFNNESKNMLGKREKTSVFLANFSFISVIASAMALILWCILPKSLIIASSGFLLPVLTSFGTSLAFIFFGGLALGFIIGVISLMMLKRSKNKSAERKALIGIAPILLFFLIYFFASLFGK